MPPKAILFDFDGVIADTGNHHIAAWQRTLAVMGWQVADEVAARSAEVDDREFLAELFAARGIKEGKIDDWVRRKQVLTVQLLNDAPQLFPGVVDLIRELQGLVRLAVVSGTWRENIKTVLGVAGLADSFDVIVSKEDVTAGKPAPRHTSLLSSGSDWWQSRQWPLKILPRDWRPREQPESAPSPWAIAAHLVNGSAMPPISRVSNRPTGCYDIWDCEWRPTTRGSHQPRKYEASGENNSRPELGRATAKPILSLTAPVRPVAPAWPPG